MLKLVMDAKGPFPKKMLRRAAFAEKHFDNDVGMSFRLWEEDPVTKRPVRRGPAPAAEAPACLLICPVAAAGRAD
jgi:serine/threonine-protein kinase PRP4